MKPLLEVAEQGGLAHVYKEILPYLQNKNWRGLDTYLMDCPVHIETSESLTKICSVLMRYREDLGRFDPFLHRVKVQLKLRGREDLLDQIEDTLK